MAHTLYKIFYGNTLVYLGRTNQPLQNRLRGHFFKKPMHRCIDIELVTRIEYAEFEMPKSNYDYAFVDTWRDASDGAPMYERMKKLEKLSPNTKFSYWIENFLISRLRAFRFEKLYKLVADNADDAPKNYKEFTEMLVDDGCNI